MILICNPKYLGVHRPQVISGIELLDNVIFLQRGFTAKFSEADSMEFDHLNSLMN